MAKFTCSGFRPVNADSASEAAEIIAQRLARREYGKRGHVRTQRLDSWSRNGTHHTFEAFIGRPVPGDYGTTSGHNVWIHVTRA